MHFYEQNLLLSAVVAMRLPVVVGGGVREGPSSASSGIGQGRVVCIASPRTGSWGQGCDVHRADGDCWGQWRGLDVQLQEMGVPGGAHHKGQGMGSIYKPLTG